MAFTHEQDIATSTRAFIRQAMREEMLSKDDEYALIHAWQQQQNQQALSRLMTAHYRLVVSIAQKFRHYGLSISDILQEGQIGLLHAANRFETAKDVRFSTYATWWIKACCQDFVLRNWSIVRTGTTAAHKSLFFNLRRLRSTIEENAGEALNHEGRQKIAGLLNVRMKDVEEMETRLAQADQSLNAVCGVDAEDAWQDFLVDSRATPEEATAENEALRHETQLLETALAGLSPRERTIITARKLQEQADTLEEVGRRLGVSKERVRQLEARAMEKMKECLMKTRQVDA